MGDQHDRELAVVPEVPAARPGLDEHVALVTLCHLLAGVSGTCVLSLLVFYAVELPGDGLHVFGPTSDLTTSVWFLLLVPLLLASAGVVTSRGGRVLIGITGVLSVIGAVSSMLLVIEALSFSVSTPISVVSVLVQAAWLFTLCGALRRLGSGAIGAVRLGRLMSLGLWAGAVIVGVSFVLGWGSVPQVVVMVIGLVPGLLSWSAWPVWFWLMGRALGRPPVASVP